MKKIILFACFILSVAALTGCETMEGAGRDIEKAGKGIQDAAD